MGKIGWKTKEELIIAEKTPLQLLEEKVASLEARIIVLENKTP